MHPLSDRGLWEKQASISVCSGRERGWAQNRLAQQKAERLGDVIISAHTRSRICAKFQDAYSVFEDGAPGFSWVAGVPLHSNEEDRGSR